MKLYNDDKKDKIPKHIFELIENGESQTVEFKFEISDANRLARNLVAFANTDGGIILIGVKDNGKIAGIQSEEELYMVQAAAKLYSRPPIKYIIKDWTIGEKTILEVIISRSQTIPHYAKTADDKWIAYIRSGDKTFPANKVLLEVWKHKKSPKPVKINYTRKEQFLLSYLEDYQSITLEEFAQMAQISVNVARKILVDFILLDIIDLKFTEKEVIYFLKNIKTV